MRKTRGMYPSEGGGDEAEVCEGMNDILIIGPLKCRQQWQRLKRN